MKKELSVILSLLMAYSVHGQMLYTRTSFKSTYKTVGASAVKINPGTQTNQFCNSSGLASGDDGTAYISLPFDFNYAGTTYTTANYLGICTNGFIYPSLNNTNSSKVSVFSGNLNAAASIVKNTPVIAPYWCDMATNSSISGFTGSIAYEVTGLAGARVLTIEWINYPSFRSFTQRALNFEVKIYEGSNIIEFLYGPVSINTSVAINSSETACIGIKNATGGPNNFIDAITGSSVIASSDMNSLQFPLYNFRFTPGAPVPLSEGTYSVGSGQLYPNLSEAIADLNHRGVSGPVTLNLTDAIYDTSALNGSNIFPLIIAPVKGTSSQNKITIQAVSGKAVIRYRGNATDGFVNSTDMQPLISAPHNNEPIISLIGADWIILKKLRLEQVSNSPGNNIIVKRGLLVLNASSSDGAQNNTFQDIDIQLDRTEKAGLGVEQSTVYCVPVSAAGANTSNHYYNFSISNVYSGIFLNGSAAFPDLQSEIGTVDGGISVIGDTTAFDIGNGTIQSWGIKTSYQSGFKIFNTEIRNVATSGNFPVDGICIDFFSGTSEVFNNRIHDISNSSISSKSIISGIRANHYAVGNNTLHMHNNFISRLKSYYTGPPSSVIQLNGIYASGTVGSTAQEYDIDYNSVMIDGTGSPNISSTCFQTVASMGAKVNARNNIFFNATTLQSSAKHYSIVCPPNVLGSTGSIWDYNDFYISNAGNGAIATDLSVDYNTISDWRNASGQDNHSLSVNPGFYDDYNLHIASTVLNNSGNGTGITWAQQDIDGDIRCPLAGCAGNGSAPDIGADEFNPSTGVVLPVTLIQFSGFNTSKGNMLTWVCSSGESDLKYYIERSSDGNEFSIVGFVQIAVKANGSNKLYAFTDADVQKKNYYYRLKQVEKDNKFSYSPVILVRAAGNEKVSIAKVFPNPIADYAQLLIDVKEMGEIELYLYTQVGALVHAFNKFAQKGSQLINLEMATLKAGIYLLTIKYPKENRLEIIRLIKS